MTNASSAGELESSSMPYERLFVVYDLLDQESRPLGEHRAAVGLPGSAPTLLESCPYAGGRKHHQRPMNASALHQTTQHWDEIVDALSSLRALTVPTESPSTLSQLWQSTTAAAVLPSFLLHRKSSNEAGPITLGATELPRLEPFIAGMFKASLGLKYMVEQHALEGILTGSLLAGPVDAQGSMPFRVERNSHSLASRQPPIPPPFPPAGRGRVALCRQGCQPKMLWLTTLWQALDGSRLRQGQALRVACGQP
jgi:hypothetical protein